MKVWWVFEIIAYYPSGGMGDFVQAFDTKEEAEKFVSTMKRRADYEIEDISNVLKEGKF